MKNSSFTLLLLFIGLVSFSQENETPKKINEFYFSPRNISPLTINLIYKRQISDKNTFFKLGFININGMYSTKKVNNSSTFPEKNLSLSSGLIVGLEFRNEISRKFTFYNGPNIIYSHLYREIRYLNPIFPLDQQKAKFIDYVGGLSYTFGLLFKINEKLLLATDISPSIIYSNINYKDEFDPTQNTNTENFNLTLNNSLLFSIVYRP